MPTSSENLNRLTSSQGYLNGNKDFELMRDTINNPSDISEIDIINFCEKHDNPQEVIAFIDELLSLPTVPWNKFGNSQEDFKKIRIKKERYITKGALIHFK